MNKKLFLFCAIALFPLIVVQPVFGMVKNANLSSDIHDAKQENLMQRPNVLLIVADDLGYSDLGAYGSEIDTPNLDALAKKGTLLSNFHTSPTCSPARSMLLSGVDSHRAGLGNMLELLADNQRGKAGYEGYLNNQVLTVAEILQRSGYQTLMSGKWHLGREQGQLPADRGFEQSFALLQGGGSHFDERGMFPGDPVTLFRENKDEAHWPKGAYSSDYFTDRMISFLEKKQSSEKPFFAYLAFTAPHWPLHAPDKYIKKYESTYAGGWGDIYQQRINRLQKYNLVPGRKIHNARPGLVDWNSLSEDQRLTESRKMAVYAAMIDNLDHNVGRVTNWLKATGQYDNTLIFFMSDNGAAANNFKAFPVFDRWLRTYFDNRLENIGRPGSYTGIGPEWARVSNAPFTGFKGTTYEGGVRVPAILKLPEGSLQQPSVNRQFTSVLDVVPTLLNFADIKLSVADKTGKGLYNNQMVYLPDTGRSLLTSAVSVKALKNKEPYIFGLELAGGRAIFQGDYKAVYIKSTAAPKWQLYNLSTDPTETLDLALENPELLRLLLDAYSNYQKNNGVITVPENYSAVKNFSKMLQGKQ